MLNPDPSNQSPAIFRPRARFLPLLVAFWPTGNLFTILLGLLVALVYTGLMGTALAWPGAIATLATIAWGIWRTWHLRIEIAGSTIIAYNQLRTHRVDVDWHCSLVYNVIYGLYVPSTGIAVQCPDRKVVLFASGFLSKEDRERLDSALRDLVRLTGCTSNIPATWKTPYG